MILLHPTYLSGCGWTSKRFRGSPKAGHSTSVTQDKLEEGRPAGRGSAQWPSVPGGGVDRAQDRRTKKTWVFSPPPYMFGFSRAFLDTYLGMDQDVEC